MIRDFFLSMTPEEKEALSIATHGYVADQALEGGERAAAVAAFAFSEGRDPALCLKSIESEYRSSGMREEHRQYRAFYFSLIGLHFNQSKPKYDSDSELLPHALMSVFHQQSTGTQLFDVFGKSSKLVTIRLDTAKALSSADGLFYNARFCSDNSLAEIMMSQEQYARLLRADNAMIPCTFSSKGTESYHLEDNPHFQGSVGKAVDETRFRSLLQDQAVLWNNLAAAIENGVSGKADSEAILSTLDKLEATIKADKSGFNALQREMIEIVHQHSQQRFEKALSEEVQKLPPQLQNSVRLALGNGPLRGA